MTDEPAQEEATMTQHDNSITLAKILYNLFYSVKILTLLDKNLAPSVNL